jgi:hypothetical protein
MKTNGRRGGAQCLLDERQDLVTPFCILPVLLVVTEPKCRGNANEHQNQLGNPTAKVCETRAFFSCLTHDSREQFNQ